MSVYRKLFRADRSNTGVLVAYHYSANRGVHGINPSIHEAIVVVQWARRSLYLVLFMALISAMGYWHLPFTLWWMLAIGGACFTGLFAVDVPQDDMNGKDISPRENEAI